MRIAICDDETNILDEVSCHIEKYSEENGKAQLEVTPYSSASSLLNSIDDGARVNRGRAYFCTFFESVEAQHEPNII